MAYSKPAAVSDNLAAVGDDLEILLEREEEPQQPSRRRLLTLTVMALALAGAAAVAVRRPSQALSSKMSSVVGLSEDKGCFKKGMFYVSPHMLEGTVKTTEETAMACQARCAGDAKCAHFTFWPDGGCLLTGNESSIKAAPITYSNTTIGPKSCKDSGAFSVYSAAAGDYCSDDALYEGPSAGKSACEVSCDSTQDCNFFSIWTSGGENWCRLTKTCDTKDSQSDHTIEIYKKDVTAVTAVKLSDAVAPVLGVNGSTCEAYPACVAAGLSGSCCPNEAKVALGCCDGFPPKVQVATILPGAECSAAPACVKLNLTEGGCCPTASGVRLGCCDPL